MTNAPRRRRPGRESPAVGRRNPPDMDVRSFQATEYQEVIAASEFNDRAEKLKAILAYKQRAGAEIGEINDHAIDLCETMAGGGAVLLPIPRESGRRVDLQPPAIDAGGSESTEYQKVIAEVGFGERDARRWQEIARVPKSDRYTYYEQRIDKGELIRPDETLADAGIAKEPPAPVGR